MMRKTVRFYELRAVKRTSNGEEIVTVGNDFWQKMGERVRDMTPQARQIQIRGRTTHGESRVGKQPAVPYFYVAGVRERAEWPDGLSSNTGVVGDLQPQDRNMVLIDPTYIVPFGTTNQVAVLTMSLNSPRVTTLESWFSAVMKPGAIVANYMLQPVINAHVAARLNEASGATVFRVKVSQDGDIPEAGGGGIGEAARHAKSVSREVDIELGWTLGHRTGHEDTKQTLLEGARWVREDFVTSATVSLEIPENDKLKRRQYDLIRSHFTAAEKFDIKPDEKPSEVAVLTGINRAIESFNKEFRN